MSAAHTHEQAAPVVDPVATQPITAAEPTSDTVKPIAAESPTSPGGATAIDAPATAPAPETAATEAEAEKLASKDEAVVESQPINEGVLQYKAPGLVKRLISSKRYFWFSEEPVDPKHFSEYLSSGKPDAATAHHNVAHASQTGKGLLFYAKRAEDKDHPAGVLNLSEATDVTKHDLNDFSFKISGQKHTFSAPTGAERDGWLVALETRSTEAKEAREGLIASEGYKSQHEKLTKPSAFATTAVASRPKKSIDGSKVHDGTSPTDNVAVSGPALAIAAVSPSTTTTAVGGADAGKSKSKSRSRSRKRVSIFGALRGKKEEHEEKKELKKEEKAEEKAEKEGDQAAKPDIVAEQSAETSKPVEAAPLDAAAIASRVIAAPVIPADEATAATVEQPKPVVPEETAEPTAAEPAATSSTRENLPKPTKRNSIFGFFAKKDSAAPGAKDVAPLTPVKDAETNPVSATAPQLDDPVTTASPEATSTSRAAEPYTDSPDVSSPTATATTPDDTKDKRRTSFFGTLGTRKEKKAETPSDSEVVDGEKKTPIKFGSIFRKSSSRRGPSGSRAPNNFEATPPIPDSTETSAAASKETATVDDAAVAKPSTPAVDEPTITKTATGPTPVPATA